MTPRKRNDDAQGAINRAPTNRIRMMLSMSIMMLRIGNGESAGTIDRVPTPISALFWYYSSIRSYKGDDSRLRHIRTMFSMFINPDRQRSIDAPNGVVAISVERRKAAD